jgi:hypothetical protein
MTGVHTQFMLDNSVLLNNAETLIKKMMMFLKDNAGFKSYFVQDLLKRGKITTNKIAEDDYEHMNWDMHSHAMRKELKENGILGPYCLMFFAQQIHKLDYITDEKQKLEFIRAMFNIHLGYSIFFMKDNTSTISVELLQGCMESLHMV